MKHLKMFEDYNGIEVINEALNKDMKAFGSDLGKYLKNAKFDVKFLNGPMNDEQKKTLKNSKGIVALEVHQNNEMQTLYLHFNPSEIKTIESVIGKFKLSDYNGPVLQRGWTSKQVRGALNPGDIFKSDANKAQGTIEFYRIANVDRKVVTKPVG
jgi:hypothetical protein